jgi:U3 small nucleolar RNA-associated protein 12
MQPTDAPYLASGGCDCDIVLWDTTSLTVAIRLRGHRDAVTDLVPLPGDRGRRLLLSASKDTQLKVWCLDSRTCLQTLLGHRCEIWSLALLRPPGESSPTAGAFAAMVVTGASDGVLRGFSVKQTAVREAVATTPEEEEVLVEAGTVPCSPGHDRCVRLQVSPTGGLLAAQSSGRLVDFFAVRSLVQAHKKQKRRGKRLREKGCFLCCC